LQISNSASRAPLSYFIATDVGEIVNRFSQDMALVDFPLPMALMMALECALGSYYLFLSYCPFLVATKV